MLILHIEKPKLAVMGKNENQRKHLIFLTSSFPFGSGETFIENEIPFLSQAFEKVFILVSEEATSKHQRATPQNVKTITVKQDPQWFLRIKALFCFSFWQGLQLDLKRENRQTGFVNVFRNAWHYFTHAIRLKEAIQNLMIEYNLKPKETILYSYWLDEKALGAAFVKKYSNEVKAVSRAHRWDIYEEMHAAPFLPFRPWLGKHLECLVFIAKQGMDYFKVKYPEIQPDKLVPSYLGTLQLRESSSQKTGNDFSIVSCSSLIPRKRVELIAHALLKLNKPINWTHIGDGPERDKIEKLVQEIEKLEGRVSMTGNLTNKEVRKLYESQHFDLFISTSDSEGLPVSMMEAQSAGIPILATDVGGVGEIVIDGATGWLLPANPDTTLVAGKINEIYDLPGAEKQTIRDNALKHWQKNFNGEKNYAAFIHLLQNL